MAAILGPKIVRTGLILELDAADINSYIGTGTNWRDMVGSYNGTLTNDPTFSSLNGGNIVFDGINDYVNIPYNVNLNPSTNVTISVWIRLTVSDVNIRNAIELSAFADELYFLYFRADLSPKKWGFGVRQSNNTYAESTSNSSSFLINTWYNVTLVAKSSTLLVSLYINGALDGSVAYDGTLKQNAAATLSLGRDPGANRRYWQGNISSALIYNRGLSVGEVLQNYNAVKSRFGL